MKILEKILYFLLLLLMSLPAIQKQFGIFHVQELSGDFRTAEKSKFTFDRYYYENFEKELGYYLKDNMGFHPLLIRINNQIDYSLYNEIHAEGVVPGYQKQYFEYDYIRSYTGEDYLGGYIIDRKIRKLKFLQTYLKDSLDIDLIFILEPGKASFYPELILKKYLRDKKETNNYREILNKSEQYGLKTIDMNSYYASLREQMPHPLYGQYGTHWTPYGMSLVADSILKLVEAVRGIKLREVYLDTLLVEEQARQPDYDMGLAMNLLFRLKDNQPLAYPEFSYGKETDCTTRPSVLVVGDSYYWNFYNTRIPRDVFANEPYWYFGKLVYPENYLAPTFVKDLNVREEVEKQDVVLLMTTERFLYKFDWELAGTLYKIYGTGGKYNELDAYITEVLTNEDWFESVIRQAKQQKKSMEEILLANAKYSFWSRDTLRYTVFFGLEDNIQRIKDNDEWMSKIPQKAIERNVTEEEMIRLEALYDLSANEPLAFEIIQEIEKNKVVILNDSLLSATTRKQAAYYLLDFEEMLEIKASQMAGFIEE